MQCHEKQMWYDNYVQTRENELKRLNDLRGINKNALRSWLLLALSVGPVKLTSMDAGWFVLYVNCWQWILCKHVLYTSSHKFMLMFSLFLIESLSHIYPCPLKDRESTLWKPIGERRLMEMSLDRPFSHSCNIGRVWFGLVSGAALPVGTTIYTDIHFFCCWKPSTGPAVKLRKVAKVLSLTPSATP